MYADPGSRGGILEPEGIVGIKMRRLEDLQARIDPLYASAPDKAARKTALAPVMHQVAVAFADAHDTPGRMLSKGVIRDIVPLSESRRVLGWRLERLLLEEELGIDNGDDADDDAAAVRHYRSNAEQLKAAADDKRRIKRIAELKKELDELESQMSGK